MVIVPIDDTPSQDLNVTIGTQYVKIELRTRLTGSMYCNLYVNDTLIIGGVICQNLNPIVRDTYLGFSGDLLFIDNQGSSDPTYPGLGTRYQLIYVTADDITAATA